MDAATSILLVASVLARPDPTVPTATAPAPSQPQPPDLAAILDPRSRRYDDRLEAYLRRWLVDDYPARAAQAWRRDYAGLEAFLASVEPDRRRWQATLKPPALSVTGPLQRRPHEPLADLDARWLTLPLGPVEAEGILALPQDGKKQYPLVITPHGLGGSPEGLFGLEQENIYHACARHLVRAGYAVLAPFHVRSADSRNRLERLCRLADTTLTGLEMVRLQKLLDAVLTDPRLDPDRIAMWGVSLGGRETLFWMPLEPRIHAGIVSAWFNRRPEKMAVPSTLYSCFLDSPEEHAFLQGWLTRFADADLVSLICPRPLLVQTGRRDPIAHWPYVREDVALARRPYERLGLADRIEFDLHDGGHELQLETALRFLDRWLRQPPPTPPGGARP